MRTAHSLTVSRSIQWGFCPTPLDADPPRCRPPACRVPWMQTSWMQTPHWMQTPVNRRAHGCKNITLPQTWFAGGNICNRVHVYLFLPSDGGLLISLMFSQWSLSRHCDWSGTLKVPTQRCQQTLWFCGWRHLRVPCEYKKQTETFILHYKAVADAEREPASKVEVPTIICSMFSKNCLKMQIGPRRDAHSWRSLESANTVTYKELSFIIYKDNIESIIVQCI